MRCTRRIIRFGALSLDGRGLSNYLHADLALNHERAAEEAVAAEAAAAAKPAWASRNREPVSTASGDLFDE